MMLELELQQVWSGPTPPYSHFYRWVLAALTTGQKPLEDSPYELCIRIEDRIGSGLLNEHYRHCLGPTNVLAFQFEPPLDIDAALLPNLCGDVVLCGPLVWSEAIACNKSVEEHWALLTIHGVLHMLGYDHKLAVDFQRMMSLEQSILAEFDMLPPYNTDYH